MRKIKLTQGKYALVDDADYEFLNQWKWCYKKNPKDRTGYAIRRPRLKNARYTISMHQLIVEFNEADHVNGNGIDNRRKNLREADSFKQGYNTRKHKNKKTLGCKGVSFHYRRNPRTQWCARISVNGKRLFLGNFDSHTKATRAYIKAAKKHHGDFARWK